jgi:hypothetical protein
MDALHKISFAFFMVGMYRPLLSGRGALYFIILPLRPHAMRIFYNNYSPECAGVTGMVISADRKKMLQAAFFAAYRI